MKHEILIFFDRIQVFIRKNPFSIVLVLLFILLVSYFLTFRDGISSNNGDWGAFGDFFNGVSAPFIGIIGLVLTFTIINNQTRESRQSEYKFIFQLLFSSLEQEVEKIRIIKGKKVYSGHSAFDMINNHMNGLVSFNINYNQIYDIEEVLRTSFIFLQRDCNYSFSTYLNKFHNCLKVIGQQCNEEHRDTYINLFKAEFSENQKIFFLYSGLGKPEFRDHKQRLEKYGILSEVRKDTRIRQDVKNLYKWIEKE